ncbi:iron chelate uptake ABC transporter family permease subunit [Enterobacter sp. RHBSTW-00994]|uniref:iron chelate uptake ABC transporter family permease subunit n=1 Tax=Enterobacter sp. RHBSTW-00994 TaxID=2742676 RepID=UPI0020179407|nr:iron chelate uptake ABC transporter family permease subunit [Enterobacter sp. RHBSTW-00994]
MGLGQSTAQSLGVPLRAGNILILLLTALLTAAGTLLAGPLSFIGLLAPQCARVLGAYTPRRQLLVATLVGALLMVLADWLGRNIAWPWPISAGLLTAFIGAPWFLWQIRRSSSC